MSSPFPIAAPTISPGGTVSLQVEIEGIDGTLRAEDLSLDARIGALTASTVSVVIGPETVEDVRDLFGRSAVLRVGGAGPGSRAVRGIVKSAVARQTRSGRLLQLEVVPALWLLSQTLDSRIYQDVTAVELVTDLVGELLGDRGYEVRDELTESYLPHDYLVQHRESHLELLTRVLHEEGIWFTFDHEDDHEVLVLCDSNSSRPPIDNGAEGRVSVSEAPFVAGSERVRPARVARSLGPTDAVVSGFDWTNPDLEVQREEPGGAQVPLEVHEHDDALSHHDYDGGFGQYTKHTARRRARIQRERFALSRTSWTIDSNVVSARPGEIVKLAVEQSEHFLVVGSRVNATPRAVTNVLRVVPVELPYRPAAPSRMGMPGPETATVVGPGGESVHVDQHGRVKVQFHWDRRGTRDDHSSAWIRVAQAWVGPGGGTVFIPQVGTEVIVNYLGGDPDRPVIMGSLYNGRLRPPLDLPAEKTKSGFSSASEGGGNALWFDDAPGAQKMSVQASGSLEETVGGDRSASIGGASSLSVGGGQTLEIGGALSALVEGAREEMLRGGSTTTIEGGERREVRGGSDVEIEGGRSVSVEGGCRVAIDGGAERKVIGDVSSRVHGTERREVYGALHERVHGPVEAYADSIEQTVAGDLSIQAAGSASLTSTSSFKLVGASASLTSLSGLGLTAASLELAGQSLSQMFTTHTSVGQAVTQVANALQVSAGVRSVSAGIAIESVQTESRSIGTRVERLGQDIRTSAVSILGGGVTLIN